MPEQSKLSKRQRLESLEGELLAYQLGRYKLGLVMKEVRDQELYKEDGYETWAQYCRERWDLPVKEADTMIAFTDKVKADTALARAIAEAAATA
jgi:hypothetical protein